MNYVYIRSEPGLHTVGFYDPDGKWNAESDHNNTEDAAKRVHYLNGGNHDNQQVPNNLDTLAELIAQKIMNQPIK